jgi:hypothetical protein
MEMNDININIELMVSNFFHVSLMKNNIINKNGIMSMTYFLMIFRLE